MVHILHPPAAAASLLLVARRPAAAATQHSRHVPLLAGVALQVVHPAWHHVRARLHRAVESAGQVQAHDACARQIVRKGRAAGGKWVRQSLWEAEAAPGACTEQGGGY